MWEFSLACSNKNKHILDYINSCFCADLPDCMLTTFTDNHFTYLLFACEDNIKNLCKAKIKKCITTYIIDEYKYHYFINKILKNKTLVHLAYIKALTLYDVESDIALLNSDLELDRQFYIDSYIHFKLNDLVRMWQELCDLIISNINYLNNNMMIDVMKSFIATFDTSFITLKIIIEQDYFVLYKTDNTQNPIKLKDKAQDIDIINYTLLLNPKHIEIYGNTSDKFSMISLLKSLYNDKVEVMS